MSDVSPVEVTIENEASPILIHPIDELSAITSATEWRQKYIEIATQPEAEKIATFNRQINQEAKKRAGQNIRTALGDNLPKEVYREKFPGLVATEAEKIRTEKKEEYEEITAELAKAQERESMALDSFDKELAKRRGDPELAKAFNVWGQSPNHAGDRNVNGRGYNAGVIHYFEYRAFKDKQGHSNEPMSLDGFIHWSNYLSGLVNDPNSPDIDREAGLSDDSGKQGFYVLTKDRLLVISYAQKGQPFKIVTAIPGQNKQAFDKRIEDEIKTPVAEKQAKRLNYLGEGTH